MCIYETRDMGLSLRILNTLFSVSTRNLTLSILSYLIFFQSSIGIQAQFYEYGQDPGTTKWNYFSSAHYELIFPRGIDSLAMDFADKLEYFYPHQAKVLDHSHGKIPVIFHNESSFSNGVFVWAPKRLEIFTNPDPNGIPQDWMTLLALHEGRHAVQVSKLDQGFSKTLSYIAGEQAVGLITGLLPLWYLEGDAVDAETRFSYTGRGRLPSFEMGMKAILLENGEAYPFSKALLGSYKNYIPNHYELGYLLVRYGRRTYGNSLWNDMEDYAARRPYLISPTYFSLRKYGIRNKVDLYNSALELYGDHWRSTLESRHIQKNISWNEPGRSHYTNYHFPHWVNDSTLIALKSGIDQIPEFICIDSSGKEEILFRPGFLNSGRFSYRNNMIIWDEWVPDVRWTNRNYSVIRFYDLAKKKVGNLGCRTRYYTPALSNSGTMIATVEQGSNHSFRLVILDLDGKVLRSVLSPGNCFIQDPQWMAADSALVFTLTSSSGEYLYSYSLGNDTWTELLHSGYKDISYPMVDGSSVYFSASYTGIDNIYRYDLESRMLVQLTSVAFGAFEPFFNPQSEELCFADYHADGYHVVSMGADEFLNLPLDVIEISKEQLDAESTPEEIEVIEGFSDFPKGEYSSKPYRKLANAIHIHSWLPLYFDYMNPEAALTPEEFPVKLGATVLSQNLLSTVTGMLAYEYNKNTHYLHSGIRLKGRLPVVDMTINYGGLPSVYTLNASDNPPTSPNRFSFVSNTYIPLRLNTGKYITFIQPLFGYTYTSDVFPNENGNGYEQGNHWMNYRLYASSYLRKGRRDILPRLGITAFAGYKNAPFNSYNFGNSKSTGITLYLPGPIRHQTIKLSRSSQVQDPVRYIFNNELTLPRGIKDVSGLDMQLYSADYTFPIAYPDLNIESILYISRIRANLWYDHLIGKDILISETAPGLTDKNYTSYGVDLLIDFHPFRLMFPFSMGVRVAYLPESAEWLPEFMFTIDVN